MSAATRVEINPNLRIDRDCTIANLDEDVYGPLPGVLEAVEVFEPQSGLQGRGWVQSIDQEERTITLIVDWANLTIPSTHSAGSRAHHVTNMRVEFGGWHAPHLEGLLPSPPERDSEELNS